VFGVLQKATYTWNQRSFNACILCIVPVRCMSNHCACDKCRWEYSVVGACTFFTKSETPESKSSTKSSNFEAGNGNNNIKLALHTGPRTYY
jgi:hypothetical protein